MIGILVFTIKEVLEYKLKDGKKEEDAYCYWEISKYPKKFDEELSSVNWSKSPRLSYSVEKIIGKPFIITDKRGFNKKCVDINDVRNEYYDFRLYFAIKGKVKGYFEISAIVKLPKGYELRFHSEDWVEIKNGEQLKPSQGWRYYPKIV